MKNLKSLATLAAFGLAIGLGRAGPAGAVVVYDEAIHGDIYGPDYSVYRWVGPTVGVTSATDNNPFGPGTWTIRGTAVNNASNEIDAFNWSTTGDFILSWSVTPTDFVSVSSTPSYWNSFNVSGAQSHAGLLLTAGDYSAGVTSNSGSKSWSFTIEVLAPASLTSSSVAEPSTLAILGLGLAALGWCQRRTPRRRPGLRV